MNALHLRRTIGSRGPAAVMLALLLAAWPAVAPAGAAAGDDDDGGFPRRLSQTGLFAAGEPQQPGRGVRAFEPQYPLWSDGADKRRWIRLPPGKAIDASKPDAWVFPRGTRLWKEFAHQGHPVETRLIERRADGSWHFATYVWRADGRDAELAPARGVRALPVTGAPGGHYAVPSRADCLTCHEGAPVPVLGFSALQLSPDRDPLAPHRGHDADATLDLRTLVDARLLRGLPPKLLAQPPRIAARTPTERAALGYLHGNCGHCHNDDGAPAPVDLNLAQRVDSARADGAHVLASLQHAVRVRLEASPDHAPTRLVEPGSPETSVIALRMRSRDPRWQMPPLGTQTADDRAIALVEGWIRHDLTVHKETAR